MEIDDYVDGVSTGSPENTTNTSFAQGQLKSLIERIERLEDDKKVVGEDIKEVYAEAKANGFDTKVMKQIVRLRRKDRHEREEEEAILDLYMQALGMLPTTLEDENE
jgi:uncharacterized protein (UPF0335 family)